MKCIMQIVRSFNPRSHEGSDDRALILFAELLNVSIHAPTKGATSSDSRRRSPTGSFNPRSHEGSDGVAAPATLIPGVSIHAPTKGATTLTFSNGKHRLVSIHAPTKGATRRRWKRHTRKRWFQSTLPRRERRIILPRTDMCISFNPRSHEGSDQAWEDVDA